MMWAPAMLAPAAAQAPANSASSRGWLGANTVSSVIGGEGVGRACRWRACRPSFSAPLQQLGVLDLARGVGAQPVIGIVAVDEALDLLWRPIGERPAQSLLGVGDALAALHLRMAARHERLGLVIERAQELALPAVPDAGSDGADVGDRQQQQQLQPLRALHDVGEVADGLGIGNVAALRDVAHHQVLLDEPGDRLRLGRASVRGAGQSLRAMRAPTIEWSSFRPLPMSCRNAATNSARRFWMVLMISVDSGSSRERAAALDVGQHADRPDQMLVDRVVMVHVELHHGDDAAELGDEAAEHAGFVHAPQRHLGTGFGRLSSSTKDAVGFRVVRAACRR